jgi:aminomethyltransferase
MGEFANFSMPIYYRGILEEHQCVRQRGGIFDLSHMGRIWVRGKGAFDFLQWLITNDLKKMKDGKILYTPICNFEGGILDDILVYQCKADEFLLVVNASNLKKDFDWFMNQSKKFEVSIIDETDATALLAVQGPLAAIWMGKILGDSIHRIAYYHFGKFSWRDTEILVSRTGYTGEDGFEIYLPKEKGKEFWDEVSKIDEGILPIGLGARDTLRLEMR